MSLVTAAFCRESTECFPSILFHIF
jgi:hypothetical protein